MGPCTLWWPLKARATVLLGAGALACLAPPVASGEIYKCRKPQGEVSFQDRPCAAGSTSTLVKHNDKHNDKHDEEGVESPAERVARRSLALRPAPVHVPPGQTYVVDSSLLENDEWKKALNRAHRLPAVRTGSARFTLLRVWLETVKAGESIQAAGGKLRILDQDSGGGRYQEFQSGSFVILEHIQSTARRGNQDSLEVGSLLHGTTQLWVEIPPPGTVTPLGDVVLLRSSASLRSQLVAGIEVGAQGRSPTQIVIGPITVGGSYGTSFDCESAERCVAGPLAPGSYWLLFPEFDPLNSRSKFTIEPGTQTELQFRSISDKVIQRVRGVRPTAPASSS